MNVIDPRGMPILEWIDSVADLLAGDIPLMIASKDSDWREWGWHVRQTLIARGILTPDPSVYLDFEEWAMRFNQVLGPVRL